MKNFLSLLILSLSSDLAFGIGGSAALIKFQSKLNQSIDLFNLVKQIEETTATSATDILNDQNLQISVDAQEKSCNKK